MTNQDRLKQVFDETNEKLGCALRPLKSSSKVVGYDEELKALNHVINRRDIPITLIFSPIRSCKTDLLRLMINEREVYAREHVEIFELKLESVMLEGQHVLMTRIDTLLDDLKSYQDELQKIHPDSEVILFIDEVHTIASVFGDDVFKSFLMLDEKPIKMVVATTKDDFDRYIASDKPLARLFKPIPIDCSDEENNNIKKGRF